MTKKNKKIPKETTLKVLRLLVSHPTIAGFSIMVGSVVVQCAISDKARGKNAHLAKIDDQMSGLYDGTQTIVLAMAALPLITKGVEIGGGLIGQLIERKGKQEVELDYP